METKNLELAKQLRHELHRHPEISMKETWTKKYLIDFLKANTKLEIIDMGLWFYAVYHSSNKEKMKIAFRADFDALPMEEGLDLPYASQFSKVAHKCGHDGHAASLAGFALEIDQQGSEKDIFFLFQPGEETGEGAALASSFIKENNIEEIFAYHNWSGYPLKSVVVIDGTAQCASKGMTIHMDGVPSHASEPEKGKNPSFAIAKVIDAIPDYISAERNKGMVLCTIVQVAIGEKAFGLNASKGDLLLTIRAFYESEMEQLQKNLEEIAKKQAEKYNLKVSFTYNDEFPETSNHKESSDKIRQACKANGMQLIEMKEPIRASEDFGHYLKLTKGAICYIGNGEDHANLHTFEYDYPDEIIETAVELFKCISKT